MNPLAKYETKQIHENIYLISTANNTMYMYLIKGIEKDVLIDTGFGHGDLKSVVRKLTDKEVIVINTHGHPDHVGSNDSFDITYMAEDAENDFESSFGVSVNFTSKIIRIKDKDKLNIAGIPFEFYYAHSHSNSDTLILNVRDRILFSGDVIDPGQVIFVKFDEEKWNYKDRIEMHIKALEKIETISNKFDYIYPSHNKTPLAKEIVKELMELDKLILSDKAKIVPLNHVHMEKDPNSSFFRRVVKGDCSIVYKLPTK